MNESSPNPAKRPPAESDPEIVRQPLNRYFRLLIPAAVLFLVTIFASIAAMFSDPDGAAIKMFDRWGIHILSVEVAMIIVLVILAMAIDRREILTNAAEEETEIQADDSVVEPEN